MQTLEKSIADKDLAHDKERCAWLSALAARIAYQMEDERSGQKLQTNAYSVNNNHSPPKIGPTKLPRPFPGKQSAAIVAHMVEYDRRGAMIAEFDAAVAEQIPEATAGRYEGALASLGCFLGFEAERPEKIRGVGPDVLWRTDGTFDFVMQAKSEKDEDNPLLQKRTCSASGSRALIQRGLSWARCAPRIGAAGTRGRRQSEADGHLCLRLNENTKLVGALRGVLLGLISSPNEADTLRERRETALTKAHLKPDGIKVMFLTTFGKRAKSG